MAGKIQAQSSQLHIQQKVNTERLKKALEQLSSGERVNQPGDDVAAFLEASLMGVEKSSEQAQIQGLQTRLTWFRLGTEYLGEITDTLTAMSELALQANSGTMSADDIDVLDASFQGYKEQISAITDGVGGEFQPRANLRGIPLFIGYEPPLVVGKGGEDPSSSPGALNLFTGYRLTGFNQVQLVEETGSGAAGAPEDILLTGTASAGSTSSLTLDLSAAAVDDIYNGMTVSITGGTGSGQSATIADYDAQTRIATLSSTLAVALDSTSQYSIDSGKNNTGLIRVGGITNVSVASHIWGADNDREGREAHDRGVFRALTQEEIDYRSANSIADSDLQPKTEKERLERRQRNLFDPEFGTLKTPSNASRIYTQLQNAIEAVTLQTQAVEAKAANVRLQLQASQSRHTWQSDAEDAFTDTDFFKTSAEYQEQVFHEPAINALANRLYQNLAQLTTLIQNRGTR